MRFDSATRRFKIEIAIPAHARALHMAFCWDRCQAGSWDNNDGHDYAWPIIFPYIGPVLTWNDKTTPQNGVVVSFETGHSAPAWIKYGRRGGPSIRLDSPKSVKHRFELTGLTPDTNYSYEVGSANAFKSSTYKFKTAKSPANIKNVSFIVFGDAQDNGEDGVFSKLADALVAEQSDVDFILSTGDLPWNDNPGDWWTFFDKARALFAGHVVMPAIGNHDTPTVNSNRNHSSFVRYFALPNITENRVYYNFSYGPATFYAMNSERPDELANLAAIDTEHPDSLAREGVQYRWFKDQVQSRASQQAIPTPPSWTFAYWHIPPFNAGTRHGSQQNVTRSVASLFDGVIDWHFGGHEHLYQRMKPIRNADTQPQIMSSYGTGSEDGVGYLVVPSAGVEGGIDLVSTNSQPECRERLAFPVIAPSDNTAPPVIGYTRVDIAEAAIDLRVFALSNQNGPTVVVDRVRYQKPRP